MHLLYLIADLGLLYLLTRELLLFLRLPEDSSPVEAGLAYALTGSSLIILPTLITGYLEIYSNPIITLVFIILWVILCGRGVIRGRESSRAVQQRETFPEYKPYGFDSKLGIGFILVVVLILFLTSIFAFPLNFDSQSYRLSRIGYWLQEGSIHHFPTADDRQGYSAFNGDLLMMWFIGHFPSGYLMANCVQALAGIMLIAALWVFSGLLKLGRLARVAVLLSMFSVPTFVAQFTTSQNDLLVASFIFTGLTFFTSALKTSSMKRMLFGCIGISLACGTKGTVFYWGPGLVCFAAALLFLYRPNFKWLIQAIMIGIASLAILGAPRYVENWLHWGNAFSSPEYYDMVHGEERHFSVEKFTLNAASLGIQNVAPISNSMFFEKPLRFLSSALSEAVPDNESADNVIDGDRKVYLERVVNFRAKRAASDFSSIGLILSGAILAGAFLCFYRRKNEGVDKESMLLGLLSLSCITYFILFSALFKYQPYTSRYFMMLAPVGALCLGFFIHHWNPRLRRVAYYLILVLAASVAGETYFKGSNSGFQNVFDSRNYRTRMVFNAQRNVIGEEMEQAERLAFNFGKPHSICAGLFRNPNGVTSSFVPLETLRMHSSVNDFLKAEGYDALVLDSGLEVEAGGAFRRVYAHEGKFSNRQSFVFYHQSNATRANAYVTDFAYQANQEVEVFSWTLGGSIDGSPYLRFVNHEPDVIEVGVRSGNYEKRQLVQAKSESRIPLSVTGHKQVSTWVIGRGLAYDIELVGLTPLISPFVDRDRDRIGTGK